MDIHQPKPWHDLREFLKEYRDLRGVMDAVLLKLEELKHSRQA